MARPFLIGLSRIVGVILGEEEVIIWFTEVMELVVSTVWLPQLSLATLIESPERKLWQ
jgi:hypothetical protein